MNRTAADVRRACAKALCNQRFEPGADGTTWCNYAVHSILAEFGLGDFILDQERGRPMLANYMAEKLAAIDPQTAKIILGISLKYTPIEYEDQQQILKALMPQDGMVPVQAVQQLQQQLEMMKSQLMQAEVQDKVASAAAKQAKAALDMSKVKEVSASITQKKADAFHKVHEAILDEYVAKKDPHPQLEA